MVYCCKKNCTFFSSGLRAVAVGGGVAGAPEPLLLDPLRQIVERECYPRHTGKIPQILRAELGNDAGIIGAALLDRAI